MTLSAETFLSKIKTIHRSESVIGEKLRNNTQFNSYVFYNLK